MAVAVKKSELVPGAGQPRRRGNVLVTGSSKGPAKGPVTVSAAVATKGTTKGIAADEAANARAGTAVGPCVVGIGASAGGFEAIRKFFQVMPGDSGVAFIVVQHLDPTHVSLAAELFGKFTTMPVSDAIHGAMIKANHVYTAPSDKTLTVQRGRLHLTPRGDDKHLRLPIDMLFHSLGEGFGARAIGIVLSGSGTDGALGLKTIAMHGGIVLVQDPAGAEFDGMPRSAIASGVAHYVLPIEQMPKVISTYASHPYAEAAAAAGQADGDPKTIQKLIDILQASRGHDFSGYKRGTLMRRVARRMGLRGVLALSDYVNLVKQEPNEATALFRDLLIGVTEFFRDTEAWKALESDVITPLVLAKRRDDPIRIWIPGCSTGEEAYSMAMVVLDRLRRARKRCPVQIFATDTNNDALDVGRLGRYPVGIAARITPARLRRYFVAAPDHTHFTVSDELRSAVVFGIQNLFADPPFGRVDLISCRNVLIYLEPELQRKVLNIFHFALRTEGHLFLGNAESAGSRDDRFKPVSKKWRIFVRQGTTRIDLLSLPPRLADGAADTAALPPRTGAPLSQVAAIAQKLILERFSPAAVLVNSRNEALYFCGPTDDFLVHPRGAPSQDLLAMVREGLRSRVRAALREAASSVMPVNVDGARMRRGSTFAPVQIQVMPHHDPVAGSTFLVVFRHDKEPVLVPDAKTAAGALVRHLEDELQATRDDLQNNIERFEAANESLRVSNEEVVTTNEELRSLNEELESSKEELQSLNEELTTVNQQLEAKLRELEVSNSDLKNLLTSSDISTICLDEALRIKWFAPAAQRQFNLIAGDIGRPVSDIASAISDPALLSSARAVLTGQATTDHEFQVDDGRWFMRRLLPYRTEDSKTSGVIVTYTDLTERHLADDAARATRQDLSDSLERGDKLRTLTVALALAEERERRSLAQDLHDDLGQMMAVIGLKAAAVQAQKMSPALKSAVSECATAIDNANRKLRAMALQLNPPMLDQLGLAPALEWMADEIFRLYRLEVIFKDDGLPKTLEPAVSATLFRAIRELLINVAKHARVEKAVVTASRTGDGMLLVEVSDAGAGFDPDAVGPTPRGTGFGLLSVRERLGFLGGEVSIRSNPGMGTSVLLKVPLIPDKPVGPAPALAERPVAQAAQAAQAAAPPAEPDLKPVPEPVPEPEPEPTARPKPKPKPKPQEIPKPKSRPRRQPDQEKPP